MRMIAGRRVLTQIELIVVIVILVAGMTVLIPYIQQAREAGRRAACLNNMKQLGLAMQDMHTALKRFPPSCHVKRDAEGGIVSMDGWSWCVDLLPYMERKQLWSALDINGGVPLKPNADGTTSHADALAMVIPELHCPSFQGTTPI
ncbi:hypothetical protein LCGC14_2983400, partial [marine sediment metagenome]